MGIKANDIMNYKSGKLYENWTLLAFNYVHKFWQYTYHSIFKILPHQEHKLRH